jgi:hypothetical protein
MSNETSLSPTSFDERLRALEVESDRRTDELKSLAAEVPAAMSRRSLVASVVADLRNAPNKGEIVVRGGRKLLRLPGALVRRLTRRT